jgi:hypothetical protein
MMCSSAFGFPEFGIGSCLFEVFCETGGRVEGMFDVKLRFLGRLKEGFQKVSISLGELQLIAKKSKRKNNSLGRIMFS